MKDLITLPGKIHTSQIIGPNTINITYSKLKTLRDNGKLIEGKFYRITDYVTTVNEVIITNARSVGHQFDLLVRADSANTLNEQAWTLHHDGDDYFKDSRLEAWELRYRLDNVQWSKQAGTYVIDEEKGYTFSVVGDITISGRTYKLLQGLGIYVENWSDYALMETMAEGEQIICYYGDPEEFDPEEPEVVGTASGVEEVTEDGTGTILWMKDEFGNECPYDFKNIQFKRWKARNNENYSSTFIGKYMIADPKNCPAELIVVNNFIWAFTFSSDWEGGEQTDYSLGGHQVYRNHFSENNDCSLPNNVFYGESNYHNKFGFNCFNNSWGSSCRNNSWGNSCQNNSWSFGCSNNSWGNDCSSNSWDDNCSNNSWGNDCSSNSWYVGIDQSIVFNRVQNTRIATARVKNIQVLNGLAGTSSSKLTLNFAPHKNYTQVATKTSAGELKIYVPGDLA